MNKNVNLQNAVLGDGQTDENPFLSAILSCILFFMVFLLGFVICFGFCTVRMDSMNNTLYDYDNILIYNHPLSIRRGDIVIIKENKNPNLRPIHDPLIKRVIATGGDTLLFEPADVNGLTVKLSIKEKNSSSFIELPEDYIKEKMLYNPDYYFDILNKPILIKEGFVFVMGDNRNHSTDSREFGQFSTKEISGKMWISLKKGSFFEKIMIFLYQA